MKINNLKSDNWYIWLKILFIVGYLPIFLAMSLYASDMTSHLNYEPLLLHIFAHHHSCPAPCLISTHVWYHNIVTTQYLVLLRATYGKARKATELQIIAGKFDVRQINSLVSSNKMNNNLKSYSYERYANIGIIL